MPPDAPAHASLAVPPFPAPGPASGTLERHAHFLQHEGLRWESSGVDKKHRACAAVVVAVAVSGCGVSAQKNAVEMAISSDKERAEAFEATARVLDEHPEYVDQFYEVALRHPALLNRFLADTTRDLRDPWLARATARLLTLHPESLQTTLRETLDASRDKPPARAAVGRAVVERHKELAEIVTDDRAAVFQSMVAVVAAVGAKPGARAGFLDAMRASARPIAALLKSDPETIKVLMGAMLRAEGGPPVEDAPERLRSTR
jgi:hypothetical protein